MKKLLFLVLSLSTVMMVGCTDAEMGKLVALGNRAHIKCYSGGVLIYDGESSGKVQSESSSDGYYFVPKGNSMPIEISGDCKIQYLKN